MLVLKKQLKQSRNLVQMTNLQKPKKKIVAKQIPVKKIKTTTIVMVNANTTLVDAALLHLL